MFCPFCSIFIFLCNVVFSFVFFLLLLLLAASTLHDRFAQSLVSCIVLCRSLFVLLSLFFWSLYCLFFFDLLPLITSLDFSTCPCMNPKYVRGIMKKNLHIYKWKYYQHKHIYTCIKIRNESSLIVICNTWLLSLGRRCLCWSPRWYHPPSSQCFGTHMNYSMYLLLKWTVLIHCISGTFSFCWFWLSCLDSLVFFLSKTFKLFGFAIFSIRACLIKVFPETSRVH